jgi:hypothetical protein
MIPFMTRLALSSDRSKKRISAITIPRRCSYVIAQQSDPCKGIRMVNNTA